MPVNNLNDQNYHPGPGPFELPLVTDPGPSGDITAPDPELPPGESLTVLLLLPPGALEELVEPEGLPDGPSNIGLFAVVCASVGRELLCLVVSLFCE